MMLIRQSSGMTGLILLLLAVPAVAEQLCRDPQQQVQPMQLRNADQSLSIQRRFEVLDEQRVLDRQTGLEWQRCSQG
ncbi:MAG: hypothetical protein ACRCRW_13385, partial [Aeromonadaceae bacterium]